MKHLIFIAAAQAVILGSDPVFSSLEKDDGKKKNPFGDFYHAYEHDFGIPGTHHQRKAPPFCGGSGAEVEGSALGGSHYLAASLVS